MSKNRHTDNSITLVFVLFSLLIIAVVLAIAVRVQRGILGLLLGAVAVGLTIYWLRYVLTGVKKQRLRDAEENIGLWKPDVIDLGDELLVVGKIQLVAGKFNVNVDGRVLQVEPEGDLKARVKLPTEAEASSISYRNGILEIRLKKATSQIKPSDTAD